MARPAHAPSKLTQAVHDRIVEGVKLGLPMKYASQRAGVTIRVVQKWLKEAREGANGLKRSLLSSLAQAEGEFIAANVARIDKAAATGTWQASAWLLERRDPENFSAHRAELKQLRDEVSRLLKLIGGSAGGPLAHPAKEAAVGAPPRPGDDSPAAPGGLLP